MKVHSERSPKWCEICHQSDAFNSETGVCDRCASVYTLDIDNGRVRRRYPMSLLTAFVLCIAVCAYAGIFLMVVSGFVWSCSEALRLAPFFFDIHSGWLLDAIGFLFTLILSIVLGIASLIGVILPILFFRDLRRGE